jgi:hypothetical protein
MSEEEKEAWENQREENLLISMKVIWLEYRTRYLKGIITYEQIIAWDGINKKFREWFNCYADYNCILPLHQLN